MNITSRQFSTRRNFLRGAGVCLTLPFLQSGTSKAFGAVDTIRPKKILAIGNHLGFYPGSLFPKEEGMDYVSSPTLKNIEKHRDHFTVFSHLDHDTAGGHGGVNAFLTGVRKQESRGFPEKCFPRSDRLLSMSGLLPAFLPLPLESVAVPICVGLVRE